MNKFQNPDGLSPLAIGYMWSAKILSMAIETALIVCFGYWIDRQLETLPIFILISLILALVIFILRLVALTVPSPHKNLDLKDIDKK
ncbi:MAG: hypothetical protein Q4C95_07960 [Planctomycetia bacterium]|nr:hypothetical protein [Planctomycetia bacterium]